METATLLSYLAGGARSQNPGQLQNEREKAKPRLTAEQMRDYEKKFTAIQDTLKVLNVT